MKSYVNVFLLVMFYLNVVLASDESDWTFELTPVNGFAAGIDGDFGVKGLVPVNVDLKFSDLVDYVDYAVGVALESVYKDKYVIYSGVGFSSLSADASGPLGGVDVGFELGRLDIFVARRFTYDTLKLDTYVGLRAMHVAGEVDFDNSSFRDLDQKKQWVDPITGIRLIKEFNDDWILSLWGDIGGFGVSSDFVWSSTVDVSYKISERAFIKAGYSYVFHDYESGGFVYDGAQHGLLLGFGFRF
jgi:hypothetical protein